MNEQIRCEGQITTAQVSAIGNIFEVLAPCRQMAKFVATRSFSGVVTNVCAGCVTRYRDLEESGMATIRALEIHVS